MEAKEADSSVATPVGFRKSTINITASFSLLVVMASNLLAMASKLIIAMASNLVDKDPIPFSTRLARLQPLYEMECWVVEPSGTWLSMLLDLEALFDTALRSRTPTVFFVVLLFCCLFIDCVCFFAG